MKAKHEDVCDSCGAIWFSTDGKCVVCRRGEMKQRTSTPAPVAAGEGMVMVPRVLLAHALEEANRADRLGGRIWTRYRAVREIHDLLDAAPAQSPVSEGAEIERLVADLKAAHAKFADENKKAARGEDWDVKAELRAEVTGHNVMLHEAIKLVRAALTNGGDNA